MSNYDTPDVRLALLEEITENQERRLTTIEDYHREVVDRLDQKIQLDTMSQIQIEKTLVSTSTTLKGVLKSLSDAKILAENADTLARAHDSAITALLRVVTIGIPVIAGLWALFMYFKT